MFLILFSNVFISTGFEIWAFIPAVSECWISSENALAVMAMNIKKAPSHRQCTSFHATGCHFTGPVALRPRLSSGLPAILLNLCKIINTIILSPFTVHKENLTVSTLKNKCLRHALLVKTLMVFCFFLTFFHTIFHFFIKKG